MPSQAHNHTGPRDGLIAVFVWGSFTLWHEGFGFRGTELNSQYQVYKLAVIALSFILWLSFNHSRQVAFPGTGFIGKSILLVFPLVLIPTLLIAISINGQSLSWCIRCMIPYFAYTAFFALASTLFLHHSIPAIVWGLALICAGVSTIGTLTYLGLLPLGVFSDSLVAFKRHGDIAPPNLAGITVIWTSCFLAATCIRQPSWRHFLLCTPCIVMNFFSLAVAYASRQTTLCFVCGVAITVFLAVDRRKRVLLVLFLLLGCLFLPMATNMVSQSRLTTSTSDDLRYGTGTIQVRVEGLSYYWPYFLDTYGLGYGLYSTTDGEESAITIGQSRGYNHTDYGLIATLFQFGVAGVALALYLQCSLVKRLSLQWCPEHLNPLKIALTAFLIACLLIPTFNTFLFKGNQAFDWALFLALAWAITFRKPFPSQQSRVT